MIFKHTNANVKFVAGALFALSASTLSHAATTAQEETYTSCLQRVVLSAKPTDTVAELQQNCNQETAEVIQPKAATGVVTLPEIVTEKPSKPAGLFGQRILLEQQASENRFSLLQHNSNYILPFTNNSRVNNTPFESANGESDLKDYEVKFQFSIKAQLFDSIMRRRGKVFFGYTNKSFWQVYDSQNSGPFRETNHEPEVFADFNTDLDIGGWDVPLMRFGWVHQSNGQSAELSRSWNRLYGQIYLEKDEWAVSFKPLIQVDGDSADIDNPDIIDFMGNFQLGIFRNGDNSAASLLLRNNLRSENRGAVEFNLSRKLPWNEKLRVLFQYYYGYGESLIDYNVITNRASIGLQLSDFL